MIIRLIKFPNTVNRAERYFKQNQLNKPVYRNHQGIKLDYLVFDAQSFGVNRSRLLILKLNHILQNSFIELQIFIKAYTIFIRFHLISFHFVMLIYWKVEQKQTRE